MIDVSRETIMPLSQAAREVPGKPIHVSTVHRWRMKGVRGVRLECIMRGGIRYTSREALARFFAATTAAAEGRPAPSTPDRSAQIAAAEKELAELGI